MNKRQIDKIIQMTECDSLGYFGEYDYVSLEEITNYEDVYLIFRDRSKRRRLTKSEIRELKLNDLGL
jgi:hypothetical protein